MLFVDSFDHYATADIVKKWTALTGTVTIGAFGRNGTNGIRCGGGAVSKTLPATKVTLISGMAIKLPAGYPSDAPLIEFRDGATSQIGVYFNSSYQMKIKRNGAGGTTLATGTTVLSAGVYYYIELKAKIDNTTGTTEVHINGAAEAALTLTGQDTQQSANAYADNVSFGNTGFGGGLNNDQDDFYINDDAGSANNDFLGDIRVQYIAPDGAGGVTQWTPSAGSNYQNVDETAPDDDTTYNSDATIGDRDTYTLGALSPSTATIKGIQMITYARKDDAGTRTICPVIRISSTNYDQSNLPNLTTSYQYLPLVVEVSPATSVAFTLSEVNGMEAGVKTVA